jgi:hypothetical protein
MIDRVRQAFRSTVLALSLHAGRIRLALSRSDT